MAVFVGLDMSNEQRHPHIDEPDITGYQTTRTSQEDMALSRNIFKEYMICVDVIQDMTMDRKKEWRMRTRPTPRRFH